MMHEAKAAIQEAGGQRWEAAGRKGTIAGATGVGKSKIAIDAIQRILEEKPDALIYIVVPTEELRDSNWPDEIAKWIEGDSPSVKLICYHSVHKLVGLNIDLLVWDEIHKITSLSAQALTNNYVRWILGLTATVPDPKRDPEKAIIINTYCPVVFVYTLDQGVADGVVADYHLFVIMDSLDSITANIQGGTKAKPFMTTESKQYNYLDNMTKRIMAMAPGPKKADATKFAILRRMRFVYNLPSKERLAAALLSKLPDYLRIITFCGSIDQSRKLFGEDVYNSKDKKFNKLAEFKDKKVNRIGVVNAVNEGHNIPDLDIGVIVQTDSNERSLIQRMGRVVRFREGHKAIIFVLCTQGTQDEHWVRKATSDLDSTKVTYLHSREIYSGNFLQFLPENMLKKS